MSKTLPVGTKIRNAAGKVLGVVNRAVGAHDVIERDHFLVNGRIPEDGEAVPEGFVEALRVRMGIPADGYWRH